MFKFGDSYVVTLKEQIVLPSGQWVQTIYGDYKGVEKCEVTEVKYVKIGNTCVDASLIRAFVKSRNPALNCLVKTEWFHEGEVIEGYVRSPIGNAHSF